MNTGYSILDSRLDVNPTGRVTILTIYFDRNESVQIPYYPPYVIEDMLIEAGLGRISERGRFEPNENLVVLSKTEHRVSYGMTNNRRSYAALDLEYKPDEISVAMRTSKPGLARAITDFEQRINNFREDNL